MKKVFTTAAIKQILLSIMLCTLVLGPFEPLIASATTFPLNSSDNNLTSPPTGVSAGGSSALQTTNTGSITSLQSVNAPIGDSTGASSPSASTATTPPTTPPADTIGCSIGQISICLSNVVYVFTVGIGSAFAYVAADFFDFAVHLSLDGPIYALTFISTGWTTARDLANMAFLFILIYIAFTIILAADTSHTMSLLAGVIVIALLVNFSFFFTRLIIDAGNILSIQFYNSIQAPLVGATNSGGVQAAVASLAGASGTKDLTIGIMGMLNLQGLFGNSSFQAWSAQQGGIGGGITQFITLSFLYIGAAIMLWLLTVTFVTAGIKFLMRVVVLWFLIIASPLAFVARAVPQFKKYFDTWRDMLISHAFYPVAFMFIFLILTNFANQMGSSGSSNFISSIFSGTANGQTGIAYLAILLAQVSISMGFIIGILYIGLKASDRISVMGAGAAEKAGNWVGSKYIGAFGATGRNTVGWAGNSLARNSNLREAASKGGLLGTLAKGARFAGNAAATSSFDVRGLPGGKALGTAQKGGYQKSYEERVKAKEKKAKDLEPTSGDKAQARAKAEKDPEYISNKVIHEHAKKEMETADRQIKDLEARGEGGTVPAKTLKATKKAQQTRMNIYAKKMKDKEKEISGEDKNKKEYANYLERRRLGNFFMVTKSAREAADHLRHTKTNKDKIFDAVKEAAKDDTDHEEPAHAPVVAAPAAAPAGGGAPAGGAPAGDHH